MLDSRSTAAPLAPKEGRRLIRLIGGDHMPTAFTHIAVGAALTQAAPAESGRLKTGLILAGVASLPDFDVLAFHFGIPYSHLFGHRGFFHSLTFALIMALVALALFYGPRAFSTRRGLWTLGVLFLAGASHGLLDAATDAGLGIGFFLPFEGGRYFFDFRPIETASVNPAVFFSRPGRALVILRSEIIWVWLPLAGATVLWQTAAFFRRRIKSARTSRPAAMPSR